MTATAPFIDFTKVYTVEQKLAKGDETGLAANGLSRHVGTLKTFSVAFNDISKKYQTGLDEFAPEIQSIGDKDKREAAIEWIRKTKKDLELAIGKEGILDPKNSDFWDLWKVDIEISQDKKVIVMGSHPQFMPSTHWTHKLALITIAVGGDIPMSKKEASDPRFKNSQFYVTTSEEEVTFSKDKVKKSRQRAVEMAKLFPLDGESGGNFERAWSIAYLLGVQKELNVGIEKLEDTLEMFSPQPEYLDRFLSLCKMDDAEIAVDVVIKKAINYDIIKFRPEDKMYYRGGHNFRNTEAEVAKYFKVNMGEAAIAREFAEIKDAVTKKDSKAKKR